MDQIQNSLEKVIWTGRSSQWKNCDLYLICTLTCFLVVPVFYAAYRWLQLRCRTYELTNERLNITQGILSRRRDQLELYRVRDLVVTEPFFQRMMGLGNVGLLTMDNTHPVVVIEAVAKPVDLHSQLRSLVENCRMRRGVRAVDFDYPH
ncbi:PH domain-containing protein [bacterium]|nr:PH domain-containing protein [bacterium]